MNPNRANLDDTNHSSTYLILTTVLVLLSAVGLFLFLQLKKTPASVITQAVPTVAPTIVPDITFIPSPTTAAISVKPTKTIPTVTAVMSPTPTPEFQTFTSDTDKFTFSYSSARKLYQDKEFSGNRYTLYSIAGNIAIHVGTKWSWTYPDRQFSSTLLVSGLSTFVYDTDNQTIVDFQSGDKNYTVQCVHNGNTTLKAECQKLLADFKIN